LLLLGLLAPWPLAAQQSLVLAGRVVRVRGADSSALRGVRVVLHRIGMRAQGPLDSVPADAAGRFRFRIAAPDTQSLYVVSVGYAGIGYFSEPVPGRNQDTPAITLAVFDTATTGRPLALTLRHVVVGRGPNGERRVLDIAQVVNPDAATRIVRDSTTPLWWMRLAHGALAPQVGEGDVSPDAVRFHGDSVLVTAPFQPGTKQIVVLYDLAANASEIAVPVDALTGEVELLLEDSASVAGAGLREAEPLTIESRRFRRFTAAGVQPGTVLNVAFGRTRTRVPRTTLAVLLACATLAVGAVIALRVRSAAQAPEVEDADLVLGRIVALDERYAGRESQTPPAEWAEYQRARADLKARLARRVAPGPS
jgi:hypothetical protein